MPGSQRLRVYRSSRLTEMLSRQLGTILVLTTFPKSKKDLPLPKVVKNKCPMLFWLKRGLEVFKFGSSCESAKAWAELSGLQKYKEWKQAAEVLVIAIRMR